MPVTVISIPSAAKLCRFTTGMLLILPATLLAANNNGVGFDFDAPPPTRFELTPDLRFGAKLEIEGALKKNFDLRDARADELKTLEPMLSLAFSYEPSETVQAYLNIEPSYRFADDERNRKKDEERLEIKQAFLSLQDVFSDTTIKLGRQRYQDEREWLYDDELDGLRLFHTFSRYALEFSVITRNDRDLLQDEDIDKSVNYVVHARHVRDKHTGLGLYAFAHNSRETPDEDFVLFGLHAKGEVFKRTDYWLGLAYVHGETDSSDIRAWALDFGGTRVLALPYRPAITLGYAWGSGNSDPGSGTDRNFRQTGLQDNTAKYNGRIRLKYYGEVVDPELSNLKIATVGLGIRPTHNTSVDLVYHNFRQDEASSNVRDWDLKLDPDGISTELGNEIDLIAGYRFKPRHKGSLIIGWFQPGDAFPNDADSALYAELNLEFLF
jgi:alginate production protein